MDVEIIRGILLCTRNQEDFWSWHFEKNGVFTVRSAYRVLVSVKKTREDWLDGRATSSSSVDDGKAWSKLWKTKVPSKVRVFLWRLA
jgi:LPS sulfotransferase NodH